MTSDTEEESEAVVGFANKEFAQKSFSELKDHKRGEKLTDAKSGGTKAWLEEELNRRSKTVAIYDRDFEFRPMGTNQITDIIERANSLGDEEDISEMPQLFRDICTLLGKHCLDPDMDAEAFGSIPPDVLQSTFEEVGVSALDEDEKEEIESFREK